MQGLAVCFAVLIVLAAIYVASWRALVERNDLEPFEKKLAAARGVLAPSVSEAAGRKPPRRR